MDKLTGDPKGIEALKELVREDRGYFRFLVTEAQTSSDHCAPFTAKDGTKYKLHLDAAHDRMEILRSGP